MEGRQRSRSSSNLTIALMDNLKSETEKQREFRKKIAMEIWQTEQTYVSDLLKVFEVRSTTSWSAS
jgi:hypothetical protein